MIVYKITNLLNGKIYIGQTIQKLNVRWNRHCSIVSGVSAISSAIDKYGRDNFTIEEIDGANSQSELNYLEKHYIANLGSKYPNGYNIQDGGNQIGRPKQVKRKKKGPMSEIQKQKIRQTMKERGLGGLSKESIEITKRKNSKPVYCKNNGICYLSLKKATEDLEIGYSAATSAIQRGNKTRGYKFYYIYR